jgi:hypothetical protein
MITINLEQNYLFVYQGQKMHLFLSLSFLPRRSRGLNRREQKTLFGKGAH